LSDRLGGREESAGDMGGFSIWHLLVVLIVAMLLFGAGRVSDIGKGLGEGIRNFKKGLREDEEAPPVKRAAVVDDEEEEIQIVRVPKQLTAAPKKKRIIQVEVDEDADEEEVARLIAAKKAAQSGDEKAT
jgi:sec-independent protein translocase protein TatA